jgi:acyl carrier protein
VVSNVEHFAIFHRKDRHSDIVEDDSELYKREMDFGLHRQETWIKFLSLRPIFGGYIMSVRSTIITQFELVAKEKKINLPPLDDNLVLLDSGLDSLSFAIVVARLEDELGLDPFSADEDIEIPTTLVDFIRIYEDAAK